MQSIFMTMVLLEQSNAFFQPYMSHILYLKH